MTWTEVRIYEQLREVQVLMARRKRVECRVIEPKALPAGKEGQE